LPRHFFFASLNLGLLLLLELLLLLRLALLLAFLGCEDVEEEEGGGDAGTEEFLAGSEPDFFFLWSGLRLVDGLYFFLAVAPGDREWDLDLARDRAGLRLANGGGELLLP